MSASLATERRRRMLVTALGADIAEAMRDSRTQEIMVNPDGALRLDRLGEGRVDTGVRIEPDQVERIIRLVASHARAEIHGGRPIISAELPPHAEGRAGERFEGVLPPVSTGPCFSIRKPAERLHTLDNYVADGIMSETAADTLRGSPNRTMPSLTEPSLAAPGPPKTDPLACVYPAFFAVFTRFSSAVNVPNGPGLYRELGRQSSSPARRPAMSNISRRIASVISGSPTTMTPFASQW